MRTGIPLTILPAAPRLAAILAGCPAVIAVFGPTGVGKTAVAIALAERLRARGEDPVAVSADALQVYAGLPILTGAAGAAEQARLEHRLLGFVPVTEPFSRRRVRRGARTPRSTQADRRRATADRGGRHRPVPARRAGRPRPAPARRRPTLRGRLDRRACAGASARALLAARARRGGGHRTHRPPPAHPRARAARRRRGTAGGAPTPSCGPRRRAIRRCSPGSSWTARSWRAGSTPASTRCSPPASRERGAGGRRRRRVGHRARRARLQGAAARATSRPCAPAPAATPSGSSPGCASCPARARRRTGRDAGGRGRRDLDGMISAVRFEKWQALGNDYLIFEARRADPARRCSGCAIRTSAPAATACSRSPARRARLRRPPADLQPRRLGGRAVGQRRPRGDPLPAPPGWTDARHVLDPDARRRDPADDHRPDHLPRRHGPRPPDVRATTRAALPTAAASWRPAAPLALPARGRRQPAVRDPGRHRDELEALDLPALGPRIERARAVPEPHERVVLDRARRRHDPRADLRARGGRDAVLGHRRLAGRRSRTCCAAATRPVTVELDGGELEVDVDEALHVDLTGWAVPVYRAELSDEFKREEGL